MGLATGLVALGAGTGAAYGVVTGIMKAEWYFDITTALVAAAAGIVLTVGLGLAGTWGALAERPAPMLRRI
nr:hypothetical protein [Oleomonas cavernae]